MLKYKYVSSELENLVTRTNKLNFLLDKIFLAAFEEGFNNFNEEVMNYVKVYQDEIFELEKKVL